MALTVAGRTSVPTRFGELCVATTGAGSTDLVVITPVGSAWMEGALPAGLQELFRVHVTELPGTGRSAPDPTSSSVDAVVEAIAEVSTAVCASDPVLFGHSMNGTLALGAAGQVSCRGVIAVTPPAELPPSRDVVSAYWEAEADTARRERADALATRYEFATDETEKAELQHGFDRLRRWYDLDFDSTELDASMVLSLDWVSAVVESGRSIAWPERLRQLSVPVLLALGEYDFVAPMTAWTAENTPPHATVCVFHRSGHTPFVEEPAEFVTAVSGWLQSLA